MLLANIFTHRRSRGWHLGRRFRLRGRTRPLRWERLKIKLQNILISSFSSLVWSIRFSFRIIWLLQKSKYILKVLWIRIHYLLKEYFGKLFTVDFFQLSILFSLPGQRLNPILNLKEGTRKGNKIRLEKTCGLKFLSNISYYFIFLSFSNVLQNSHSIIEFVALDDGHRINHRKIF